MSHVLDVKSESIVQMAAAVDIRSLDVELVDWESMVEIEIVIWYKLCNVLDLC